MGKNLEFVDCPRCGKRMLSTAPKCHHCQSRVEDRGPRHRPFSSKPSGSCEDEDDESSEAHMAISGGYDASDDDFDYDETIANEFPERDRRLIRTQARPWVWITAWVLIIAILLPWIVSFLNVR